MMCCGAMGDGMAGWMTLWSILSLLLLSGLLAAAIGIVVWLVRSSLRTNQSGETPLTLLQRRYAGGEIDAAQFEQMKRLLTEPAST